MVEREEIHNEKGETVCFITKDTATGIARATAKIRGSWRTFYETQILDEYGKPRTLIWEGGYDPEKFRIRN